MSDGKRTGRAGLAATAALAVLTVAAGPASAQWLQWTDETATRLSAAPELGIADVEEKDYAWGDVDQDGDLDLVVVRKEPFTSPGKRVNVLFLNENGVLVDRTSQYAADADVPGDQGFLTPTNDRDVQLADLNGDGWLDMVTAVTISDGDPKHIGHPRIYLNLGDDAQGDWLGFRYRASLVPTMVSYTGQSGFNPRFCSVAVGDVNNDGLPDLWFGDYDSSGAGGFGQPEGADFNDRLLMNTAQGRFTDDTAVAFSGLIQIPNSDDEEFPVSAFGAAAVIADMNGDGRNDIVKQTALVPPQYVGISYNNLVQPGAFANHEVVYANAPYFVSVGDLNNDSRLDLVVTDDGQDRYLLNQGNDGNGRADFVDRVFEYDANGDDGFGSNSVIVDLDNDGWKDVLIADVDVDEFGCGRRMHIYRNQGGVPGGDVVLREETTGTGCGLGGGNPATCLVAGIPANRLTGVHDVAAMDLNGDGWQDLVIGRCGSTEIWMNQPPFGIAFDFPSPLPDVRAPGVAFAVEVQIDAIGGAAIVPGSETLHVSVGGGPFVPSALAPLGGGLYGGSLPPSATCLEETRFYVSADLAGGGTTSDPPTAPAAAYSILTAFGTEIALAEGFEGDVSAWTVVDQSVSAGSWEAAAPEGTIAGDGQQAAPDADDEPDPAVRAFVTENGAPGGAVGAADLDGGPTDLISPPIDLAGADATISYSRWFYNDDGDDALEVSVSVDGSTWVPVETVQGVANAWTRSSFRVGAHVVPGAATQVRFRVADVPNNSITEAAIDRFTVERYVCSECVDAPDCDDGVFCNGAEVCNAGACEPGAPACPGQACDEDGDVCLECVVDGDCDDGDFCNGVEICSGNSCLPGGDPCPGALCDEGADACVACLFDTDCDDGLFCNGAETCDAGTCSAPVDRCPGQTCDEDGDVCVGAIELQPRLGAPLRGLTVDELQRFEAGRLAFNTVLDDLGGLGPVFNQNSCGSCHNNPVGGSGSITVTRFGFNDEKGGGFDPLASLGGSLLQANAIAAGCEETVPALANVTTLRLTNSTLGFGLVEAIPDADLQAAETFPPPGVSGRAHLVEALEDPGNPRVGRFGWKSQVATMLTFSADAALNEMGMTNRLLTAENAPNGDPLLLADCDDVPDPEDGPDGQGFHFIDRVADFQRFLAAPPQTPRSGMTGEAVFNAVQCNACHTRSFTTADDPALEDALRNKVLRPYSDFLLHDMGQNADFIPQGQATARELRTAPLWGVRVRDPLWHDGRVAGGTFDERMRQAIALHDSLQSEGRVSAQAFAALPAADQDALIAFLDSLGRAEFDHDGDGDVDLTDHGAFQTCFTGPGSFLTPDDSCSVSDVDRDGDVDVDDFALFDLAVEAGAGRVPDGASGAGAPLRVGRAGGDVVLTWDASCNATDDDYAVYEGDLGDFAGHGPRVCSTAGATTLQFGAPAGDVFFLVVPRNALREGSYGRDGAGADRPASAAACVPQAAGACF